MKKVKWFVGEGGRRSLKYMYPKGFIVPAYDSSSYLMIPSCAHGGMTTTEVWNLFTTTPESTKIYLQMDMPLFLANKSPWA
jgi:hypothetical protein